MNRREFLIGTQAAAIVTTLEATLSRTGGVLPVQSVPLASNPCKPRIPDRARAWKFPVALWLDPIDDHRKKIENLICHFSNNYGLPIFRPHCTLVSGNIADLGQALYDLLQAVDKFCSEQSMVYLRRSITKPVDKLDNYDDSWSTFLYLPLNADREAQEVFDRAEQIFAPAERQPPTTEIKKPSFWLGARRDPRPKDQCALLMPHVSLAYGKAHRTDVDRDKVNTSDLPESLAFGSVKVVMPAADGENPGDWENILRPTKSAEVRRWNIVYSRLLLGPKSPSSRKTLLQAVIAGGQEGADQMALNAAHRSGLTIGGYCPPCRETNRDKDRPPVPRDLPLDETPERNSTNAIGVGEGAPGWPPFQYVPRSQRTEWNCRESDGVLIIRPTSLNDPGTIWTIRFAKDYNKPVLFVDPLATDTNREIETVLTFLKDHSVRILNVAGPATIEKPEIVSRFFENLFTETTSSV